MIERPPSEVTLATAMEWFVRVVQDLQVEFLLAGRSALEQQGESLGSVDIDLALAAPDWKDLLYDLEEYEQRGDLVAAGAVPKSVARYLVDGFVAVDLMNLTEIHPRLFPLLREQATAEVRLGRAGRVPAISREGYFVLAVMAGKRGFSAVKADPMAKVREAWVFIGARTDRQKVERLLGELGEKAEVFEEALRPPGGGTTIARR